MAVELDRTLNQRTVLWPDLLDIDRSRTNTNTKGDQVEDNTCYQFFPIGSHEGDTMDTLLQRVDRALYMAKEKGRNRVEVAD